MYVHIGRSGRDWAEPIRDVERIAAIKGRTPKEVLRFDALTVAGFGRLQGSARPLATVDGLGWIASSGCWIHRNGLRSDDLPGLLARYLEVGADALARELDGVYALIVGDARQSKVSIITDVCGSLHLYMREDESGIALATSSAGLSVDGQLDPIGSHEFVACGILYESRSLWRGVLKLPPASIIDIDVRSLDFVERRHWNFAELRPESLNLIEAAEELHGALGDALKTVGRSFSMVAADLTGGYDSRMLLAGLLSSGIEFQSTVSGPPGSADVLIARGLAEKTGRTVRHSVPPSAPSIELFDQAIRLCDGECDAFDMARILATHVPASKQFDASLNGSFGELARGYWWELLWPRLAAHVPLNTSLVARKRFAAAAYDPSIFRGAAVLNFVEHMTAVSARAIGDLSHMPNTSQMDGLYLRLRMQRWQGRIASTTNQLWPAISPLAFRKVLAPMLEARADARFRSLLPRTMFARKNEVLARFPLEHGYPPRPLSMTNLLEFWPVVTHYGGKVWSRVKPRSAGRAAPKPSPTPRQRHSNLFELFPLAKWLADPVFARDKGIDGERLCEVLNPDRPCEGSGLDQWHRLVTIECVLRRWHEASCSPGLNATAGASGVDGNGGMANLLDKS